MYTFYKRPGTTNKGTEFENLTIADFVLRLAYNDKIKDFCISSNDENFGAFDDIVVEIESDDGKEISALQLKHNDRGGVSIDSLRQNKGDFSIKKYFTSVQQMKNEAQKYILYTNRRFRVPEEATFQLDGEDFEIQPTKHYPQENVFRISEKTSYCYKFKIVESSCRSPNDLQPYKSFSEKFFLYVEQENLHDIKINLVRKFETMFCANERECDGFSKIISEWAIQEGKKKKLNKKWMQRAIALQVLNSRIKELSFNPINEKMKILQEAISCFDVVVLKLSSYDKVKNIWGDFKTQLEDLKTLNWLRNKYQLSPTTFSSTDCINSRLASILLWLMDKCPLVVEEDATVTKIADLYSEEKFILLGEGSISKKNISAFKNLSHLEANPRIYENLLKNFSCSLQGKKEVSLEILLRENEDLAAAFKVDDLLEMVEGPCPIGGESQKLSEPYIERRLLKTTFDTKCWDESKEGTLIILDSVEKLSDICDKLNRRDFLNTEEYMNEKSDTVRNVKVAKFNFNSPIYFTKNKCDRFQFEAICNKNKGKAENCYQFRVQNGTNLELIRSRGDINELEKYNFKYCHICEKKMWSSRPDNNINIIIGDPGMGKSELMKSAQNSTPSNLWTVVITPKDIFSFIGKWNPNTESFIQFLINEKYQNLKDRDKKLLQVFIQQNKVIYIWDALDEISNENLKTIIKIIVDLSKKDSFHWVTSRRHLKQFLEKSFNVLAVYLNEFDSEEQNFYIRRRLEEDYSEEKVEAVIGKIHSTFALVEHKDILGIPLQIFMLTELFRQNPAKYLDLINSTFVLTDLYRYFIEEKFRIYCRDKVGFDYQNPHSEFLIENFKSDMLESYEKVAFKCLFPEEISKCFQITSGRDLQKVQGDSSTIGLITEVNDGIPRFLHNSFAEYLVAVYFAKNLQLRKNIAEVIFKPKYVNIRFFFDLILAGDSQPHIAVLYEDFSLLETYRETVPTCKDTGGRNVLHLASSWGQRYNQLNVKKSNDIYIVEDDNLYGTTPETNDFLKIVHFLLDKCNIDEADELFGMTPLSYAQRSNCIYAEIQLMNKQQIQLSTLKEVDRIINIIYSSAKLGYNEVFERNKEFFFKRREFIDVQNTTGMSLLYLACQNGHFATVELLVGIGAKINFATNKGRSPIWAAAFFGHNNIVEFLVSRGGVINIGDKDGYTPLFVACQNGHKETVELLVTSGAQINRTDNDGLSPLYTASEQGHDQIVEFLVKSGSDVNLGTKNGYTPLWAAAFDGHYNIVEFLVENNAEINAKDNEGYTPLFVACQNGHRRIVEFLIEFVSENQKEFGADIDIVTKHGQTPLWIAAFDGHDDIVRFLVEKGAKVDIGNKDGFTPLYVACQNGHKTIVEFLVKSGAKINLVSNDERTPLYAAAEEGHYSIVEFLVTSSADMNLVSNDGRTPLWTAAFDGHCKIVEFLFSRGAAINCQDQEGFTPLFVACQNDHIETVEFLIENNAEINMGENEGCTPLYVACQNGNLKIVKILIGSGAAIDLANKIGTTPLYAACDEGHKEIVEFLVKSGADINRASNKGNTPLWVAVLEGHYNIVEFLVKNNAIIHVQDDKGCTPLYVACQKGHDKIVQLLLSAGSDINGITNDGRTPLWTATYFGHENIVEFLISQGAQINVLDKDGFTPLFVACQNGHKNIVEILVKSGAQINLACDTGVTPLYKAAEKGHYDIVKFLIFFGGDVDLACNSGITPLQEASKKGHFAIVKLLTVHSKRQRKDEANVKKSCKLM